MFVPTHTVSLAQSMQLARLTTVGEKNVGLSESDTDQRQVVYWSSRSTVPWARSFWCVDQLLAMMTDAVRQSKGIGLVGIDILEVHKAL